MSWGGKFLTKIIPSLRISGTIVSATIAGTSGQIKVLEYDESFNIMRATGTDVPADTTAGYAKGCLFIDTDVAAGTSGLYVNVGTTAECNFDLVSDA
jgi:hypothetical protein